MEYKMRWSAALIPEASMVPGEQIFQQTTQHISLTATVSNVPGLLLPTLTGSFHKEMHRSAHKRQKHRAKQRC